MTYLVFKMAGVKRRIHNDSDILALHKELDEVSCPICMDHPHNAVLLLCSSHHKGCKPYICDTSHRHSNCFDQFKKLREETRKSPRLSSPLPINPYSFSNPSTNNLGLSIDLNEVDDNQNINERNTVASAGLPGVALGDNGTENSNRTVDTNEAGDVDTAGSGSITERVDQVGLDAGNSSEYLNLKCPMCRGAVLGLEVIEEAREYLNLKKRSCSRETCSFSGNYQELRRHARRVHPASRPAVIDPSRERAWRRLERQREVGDVVSAIRSAMPGALVVGDYVIENGDGIVAGERDNGTGDVNGPLLTSFFLFHMFGSVEGAREPRPRSRSWVRHRRSGGGTPVSERRFLWGENLLGLQEDADEDFRIYIGMGDDGSPPTRRRRVTRPGSDADQP